jgi:FKBP-type peptidyl-prolyl cis-trans isomerase SlyD
VSEETKPTLVADNVVVSLSYTLTIGDEEVDSTDEGETLEFLQGYGEVIPGLERELYGMAIGESKKIHVKAEDAYGLKDPDAYVEVPKDQLPPDLPMEEDVELQVRDMDGEVLDARISEIKGDSVILDFNHPLAGEELDFDVTVVDLREATAEELEHGHVHDDEEFEDEEDEI